VTPDGLKAWREKHGYTQVTLAQALNVHEMTVSRWERGFTDIPPFLHLALDALECQGGEKKPRETKTEQEVKGHGSNLQEGKYPVD
jgi:DNA-binding XRE family transcriptional regulator